MQPLPKYKCRNPERNLNKTTVLQKPVQILILHAINTKHRAITAVVNSIMAIPTKYVGVGPPHTAPIVP